LTVKIEKKKLFCGGWPNFFSNFLQKFFAASVSIEKAIPAIWRSQEFYLGRNDPLKFTTNDMTNTPVTKCPNSAGEV